MSPPVSSSAALPNQASYQELAAFRRALAVFSQASQRCATSRGLTPQQFTLLVLLGAANANTLSVGEAADALLVTHHTAVGLSQRAERAGLIERQTDPLNARRTLLRLTEAGQRKLEEVTRLHIQELREPRATLIRSLERWTQALDELAGEPPSA